MRAPSERAALIEGRHGDAFAVLGLHADGQGRLQMRALLPGATAVSLIEAASGKVLVELQQAGDGLFEATVPRRRKRFGYRLAVRWSAEQEQPEHYADAYAFGPLLDEQDLTLFAQGGHPRPWQLLGAQPLLIDGVSGVRFAVWAPNAARVSVVGSFNNWDGRRHAMRRRHQAGVWEIFVPHAAVGDLYKYELLAADGRLLPLKADPYARAAQLRPETASVVAALPNALPLPAVRAAANRRDAPISIYEVHAASWRRSDGAWPSWDELAATLPAYAADLGFTHLELLPISEHPFDGSWGYQTLGLFAPSARFGPPEGFARFVAACHQQGLGLLLDWVPAHFPSDAHGLAQFDGTALYEYADPREGFHRDWNTLIYNFGRHEVAQFLAGSALYWGECWGVDGLRVDAVASMLYRDYSRPAGEWLPNAQGGRENLEAIALFKRINETLGRELPGAITVAEESTSFPGVSAPTGAGGLGFHYKWNMGWMNDTLRYIHEDPIHRKWHHDKISFGLVYAFSENFVLPISHDEVVHGKGSMLGKMPGDPKDPTAWQQFATLRAYYGFMWGHPGKKLLFMGQEFAQASEWNHDASLPWQLLDDARHAGVQRLVRDLNRLYRERPSLHRLDCEAAGFEWLISEDRDHSVFAWLRRDAKGDGKGEETIVICNFTPVPRPGYRLPVPDGHGAWREVLNTDAEIYGGSNQGNLQAELPVQEGAISLLLPPLATLMLAPVDQPRVSPLEPTATPS
ncbi:1,4-alpha-glucan branching protein GlgB [Paucibacter sp. APW11]|uniref:1,4-alpha-glucan branching enzyme GlgB n=1 Tax=Roseateles aquae TaxID=3077235 RepID=A0ABU3P6T0_9BURK|nr:1,4-alpha-glucan branching protein GlgB [Paucibacter sp. APW11]MDT8998270.1 1,4-alpha-glucan branching protein GlgB [Paucibacter sp. APW11]